MLQHLAPLRQVSVKVKRFDCRRYAVSGCSARGVQQLVWLRVPAQCACFFQPPLITTRVRSKNRSPRSQMASSASPSAARITPTKDEEVEINNAKLAATKSSYETDFLMSQ